MKYEFLHLRDPESGKAMKWSENLFDEEVLKTLRNRYESGERVALRVPMIIQERKSRNLLKSHFHIFLEKVKDNAGGRPVYIREGIVIPDNRTARTRGVRSLVVAEDHVIATFLGDSENPAHTQWQKNCANFRNKYMNGPSVLNFVINSVSEIVKIVSNSEEEIDYYILANIFPISEEGGRPKEDKIPKPDTKGDGTKGNERPALPGSSKFRVEMIRKGFVVSPEKGEKKHDKLEIKVAYQVRWGDAFKRYNPEDFDVGSSPVEIELKGAELLKAENNIIEVKVTDEKFRIKVTGFDERRDLRVSVNAKEV